MCQCTNVYYTVCGHNKKEACTAPKPVASEKVITSGVNGVNGAHGANGVLVNGFGAVGEPVPKKPAAEDARGHAGRPMTPPKPRYFCAGMPEEPMVVYQVCPACFFR